MAAATTRHFASRPAESLTFEEVLYHKADGVARITINRPQRHCGARRV